MSKFKSGDKIICISKRCPCCKVRLSIIEVGEIYEADVVDLVFNEGEVDEMEMVSTTAYENDFWPQKCFKKIPPESSESPSDFEKSPTRELEVLSAH